MFYGLLHGSVNVVIYALNGVELNEAECSKLITWADGHVTQVQ